MATRNHASIIIKIIVIGINVLLWFQGMWLLWWWRFRWLCSMPSNCIQDPGRKCCIDMCETSNSWKFVITIVPYNLYFSVYRVQISNTYHHLHMTSKLDKKINIFLSIYRILNSDAYCRPNVKSRLNTKTNISSYTGIEFLQVVYNYRKSRQIIFLIDTHPSI